VEGCTQVTEQVLKALGMHTCRDIITKRGLLAALFLPLSVDFFIRIGLGLGQAVHSGPPEPGAVGRRGMSVERTFPAVSSPAELEAWVRMGVLSVTYIPPTCLPVLASTRTVHSCFTSIN
jgi:hypothetical protein